MNIELNDFLALFNVWMNNHNLSPRAIIWPLKKNSIIKILEIEKGGIGENWLESSDAGPWLGSPTIWKGQNRATPRAQLVLQFTQQCNAQILRKSESALINLLCSADNLHFGGQFHNFIVEDNQENNYGSLRSVVCSLRCLCDPKIHLWPSPPPLLGLPQLSQTIILQNKGWIPQEEKWCKHYLSGLLSQICIWKLFNGLSNTGTLCMWWELPWQCQFHLWNLSQSLIQAWHTRWGKTSIQLVSVHPTKHVMAR